MYTYDVNQLRTKLDEIIRQNVELPVWNWLQQNIAPDSQAKFNTTFAILPRKTGKGAIQVSKEQRESITAIRPHLFIQHWTIDQICRVRQLLEQDATSQEEYVNRIEALFAGAEMNEQVALYASLPVLAYPQQWTKRCAEGIRSNIGDVLQAIMCNNPYPAEYLDDTAWNQLVLKAFFTEKPVHQIIGLDERANPQLAKILSDYAHERWAAHRTVNPLLWRCVGHFIDETLFLDIAKTAQSENPVEREAALLACTTSTYLPARDLVEQQAFAPLHENSKLSWEIIAQKATAVAH
jgi:hypothetical protein